MPYEGNIIRSLSEETCPFVLKLLRNLIIVFVDGRQPGYSEGATLRELAQIFKEQKAHFAMNLDGGDSSTLVMAGKYSTPIVLNIKNKNHIARRERAVGNHLGIFAKPAL